MADGDWSFAGGMAGNRCVALCSIRILQTFTGGFGGAVVSEVDGGCPLIVGGRPLADEVEFASVGRADEFEVDGCRIEGADRLGG